MAKRKSKKSYGTLVIQSKVKDMARDEKFRVGGDFIEGLSDRVEDLVNDAMDRAETNGRATLRAGDL